MTTKRIKRDAARRIQEATCTIRFAEFLEGAINDDVEFMIEVLDRCKRSDLRGVVGDLALEELDERGAKITFPETPEPEAVPA